MDCGNVSDDPGDSKGWAIWSSGPGCGSVDWVTESTDHDCKMGEMLLKFECAQTVLYPYTSLPPLSLLFI